MKTITMFHRKLLRGFLKLSSRSPVPSLYFMSGELSIEAVLHIDLLKLFFNILENPGTKLNQIVKYILCMAKDNSTTWSNHVRLLCKQYSLPDPLTLFEGVQYSKENWKDLVVSRVTVYHERILRQKASTNSVVGCHLGNVFCGAVGYADDLLLLASSSSAMEICDG